MARPLSSHRPLKGMKLASLARLFHLAAIRPDKSRGPEPTGWGADTVVAGGPSMVWFTRPTWLQPAASRLARHGAWRAKLASWSGNRSLVGAARRFDLSAPAQSGGVGRNVFRLLNPEPPVQGGFVLLARFPNRQPFWCRGSHCRSYHAQERLASRPPGFSRHDAGAGFDFRLLPDRFPL